jgi:hypothetical protein
MRVCTFIHSLLFRLPIFLSIDTKGLSGLLPVQTGKIMIIYYTKQAKNWQSLK